MGGQTEKVSYRVTLIHKVFSTFGSSLNQIVLDNEPFDCTTLGWNSLLCMILSCVCFWPRHFPYSNYLCRESDIAAEGTIFHIFGCDALLGRDSNL